MRVLLISTYDLGRQPFGLASPAAWLKAEGHAVTLADLACSPLPVQAVEQADLIAFFLPMHTATRLFLRVVERVKALNPRAHLCGYGLYGPLNDALLRRAGLGSVIGGEFEQPLVELARRLQAGSDGAPSQPLVSLDRQQFRVPDRTGLPPLASYASLVANGGTRRVGYTEASRGCKHLCRHCPVVPVYRGVFRVVQPEVVLADIRQQVAAGAEHITFGDPDFFNGPGHAMRIVEALSREWPGLTYDATIKIEHLLEHRDLLPRLRSTGCLFVTSAVESLDDQILEKLAKGHTRSDFVEALALTRAAGLPLAPYVHPVHPVDHSRFVSKLPSRIGASRPGGRGGFHPTRHPPAHSRRVPVAGTAGNSRTGGTVRCTRTGLSLAESRPGAWTACAHRSRSRSNSRSGGAPRGRRFSG